MSNSITPLVVAAGTALFWVVVGTVLVRFVVAPAVRRWRRK